MLQKAILSLFILLFLSQGSKAQYKELLGLSENEVKQRVTEYPIVVSRSSQHELGMRFLQFKDRYNEIKLFCNFFVGRCQEVTHYVPLSSYASTVEYANKNYKPVGDKWISSDSLFTLNIRKLPNKVSISYSRGVSKF